MLDEFTNPEDRMHSESCFLISMLRSLSTRIMAPLVKSQPLDDHLIERLNPVISFKGSNYYLSTAEMASVPVSELSDAVGTIQSCRDELIAAVDLIFTAV